MAAQMFSVASTLALIGWLGLLLSPLRPDWAYRFSGWFIPITLSIGYSALVLVYWSGSSGGFDSLASVMELFTQPEIVLAGWVHYLAFDLWIGAWECRTARSEKIPFWFVIPCLALTFMFGPVGLLLFLSIRLVFRSRNAALSPAA
ncbi:MAG: ABA4-like family protein [Rhizobiaceae bacterium]